MRVMLTVGGLLALTACSGGGSGGGGNSGGGGQPALPTLAVTLNTATQTSEATDLAPAGLTFTATYSGTPGGAVVPNVQVDGAVLALDGDIAASGTSYTVKLKSVAGLAIGSRTGEATFRLCRDAGCSSVYPGSTQKFTYTLNTRLADWNGLQRNAAHTGYVPETFDPAKFSQAWQIAPTGTTGEVRTISASKDAIFVIDSAPGDEEIEILYAFELASGRERWRRVFTNTREIGGAAVAGDAVIFSVNVPDPSNPFLTSLEELRVLGAADGQDRVSAPYQNRSDQPVPVVIDNEVYMAGGPSTENFVGLGNVVYSYTATGAPRWTGNGARTGILGGQTPGVDSEFVYYYSGSLDVIRRSDGALVSSTVDPIFQPGSSSFSGAPIVAGRKSVIAYSGGVSSPYSPETQLVSFDTEGSKVNWISAGVYRNQPAYHNGTIYAGSQRRNRIDAIDELTGQLRWSIPSSTNGDGTFSNLVVTNNLLFYSTPSGVYAISLAAPHNVVWSAPVSGELAIAPDGKLIVVGRYVTAFNLR